MRLFVIVSFLFGVCSLSAQSLTIFPPALSASNPTIVDILSGTLNNGSTLSYQAYLNTKIYKDFNTLTAEATSSEFTIPPGVLVINSSNAEALLSPVQGEFYSQQDRETVQRTGAIPLGNYQICITVFDAQTDDTLGFTCYNHSVLALNPPILLSPADGEVSLRAPTYC